MSHLGAGQAGRAEQVLFPRKDPTIEPTRGRRSKKGCDRGMAGGKIRVRRARSDDRIDRMGGGSCGDGLNVI
jgi:hypothetical protein